MEYHVTAVRNDSVYGHSADHCDESGCSGDELYLGDTHETDAVPGDLVDLEIDLENCSLSRQAARDRGEKMAGAGAAADDTVWCHGCGEEIPADEARHPSEANPSEAYCVGCDDAPGDAEETKMETTKITASNVDSMAGIPLDTIEQVREAILDGDSVVLHETQYAGNPSIVSTVVEFPATDRAAWQTNGNSVWGDVRQDAVGPTITLDAADSDGAPVTITFDGAVVGECGWCHDRALYEGEDGGPACARHAHHRDPAGPVLLAE